MKGARLLNVILGLTLLLVLTISLAQAQQQGVDETNQTQRDNGVTAALSDAIPVQGRLTDASGAPLTGNHSVTFEIYDAATIGTLLCSTNYNPLTLTNGLFNATVTGCTDTQIDGDQLYLAVHIDADSEMTPRQPIYSVPYARSLRPGARIVGDKASAYTLVVNNTSTTDFSAALYAAGVGGSGKNYGIAASSNSLAGYAGYFYNTGGGIGMFTRAGNDDQADLVLAANDATSDNGRIDSDPAYPSSDLLFVTNDKFHVHLDNNNDETNSDFSIFNGDNTTLLKVEETGRLNLPINAGKDTIITLGDRFRDNAIVAWAKISGGTPGAISSEFGVSSIDHYATGCYKIYLDISAVDAASLIPFAVAEIDTAPVGAANVRIVSINQLYPNIFDVYINNGSWALVDNDFVFWVTAR
jgi:hypothetical protein